MLEVNRSAHTKVLRQKAARCIQGMEGRAELQPAFVLHNSTTSGSCYYLFFINEGTVARRG